MSSSRWNTNIVIGGVALALASGVARADGKDGSRSNLPASSTPSTGATPAPSDAKLDAKAEPEVLDPELLDPELRALHAEGKLVELERLAPVEIIDLQDRLKILDLYHGKLDGIPGPQTRLALQRYFLEQAQLAAQGKVDVAAMALFAGGPAISEAR